MKKRIATMLAVAIEGVEQHLQKEGKVQAEYQGYISALGASIMQMGLVPTLAIFEDTDSGAAQDKRALSQVLHHVLISDKVHLSDSLKSQLVNKGGIFKVALGMTNKSLRKELKMAILDAAVATKLGIRTFELDKTKSNV